MLKGLFSPDNPVMRFFIWLGRIWWLNILWLICCLPVVTIGASTTALIYSCMKLRNDEGYPTSNFFHSFKDNLRQSTIIWMIYLAVGAVLAIGIVFWNNASMPGAKIFWAFDIALSVLYSLSLLYVFAVQSKCINTVKDTIKYSFFMGFANIKYTFMIVLVIAGFVAANIFTIFAVNFISLNIGMAIIVYLISYHYQRVFDKYLPHEEAESYLDLIEEGNSEAIEAVKVAEAVEA